MNQNFKSNYKKTNSNVKLNLKEDTSRSEVSDSAEIWEESCLSSYISIPRIRPYNPL
ncbi:MAG: hypothetical protein ACI4JM_06850 [Oscillospiraceae bacterium]